MRLASVLGASAVLVAAVAGLTDRAPLADAPAPAPVSDRSCKPQGPVEVSLLQTAASAGRAQLAWTVQPRRELRDVSWRVELPEGAVPLRGPLTGAAELAAEELAGSLEIDLPVDDRARRARLVVSGTFEGSGPDGSTWREPFEVATSLHWGAPTPDLPVVTTPAPEGPSEVYVMPTAHRMGR